MLKRSLHCWLLSVCALVSPVLLHGGSEGDAKHETPMASQRVPLRLGSVDAVSGDLAMHVPLGPKLPGRIPLGFSWTYSNQDAGTKRNGGNFRPVAWPGGSSSPLSVSVLVGGEQWMFYKQAAPAAGAMPTTAELLALLPALGVDTGEQEADGLHQANSLVPTPIWEPTISPSSDGTRFFIKSDWKVGATSPHGADTYNQVAGRLIVLNGVNAIWTKLMPDLIHFVGVSYFTNRWGDQVTVTEGGGAQGAPASIVIKNELSGQTITLALSFTGTAFSFTSFVAGPFPCKVTVTNSMSLPVATLTGANYNATQRVTYVPPGSTDTPKATGIWDAGVTPSSIVVAPTGVTVNPLSFTWADPLAPILKLMGLTHPNGVSESFTYDQNTSRLSNDSYDPLTGYWWGYKVDELENCDLTCTFDTQAVNADGDGVSAIVVTGTGVSRKTVIARLVPTGHKTGNFAWDEKRHITSILSFANASGTGTYRGVRIYHPSVDSWTAAGYTSASAYLFAASVVVGSEAIHGSSVDGTGQPTGYTVDGVTLNDGWNLKSWANPTASLGSGLPVNPVARRTRSYAPDLPVKTVIAGAGGAEDAFGPTQTDEYTDNSNIPTSLSMPTVNTTAAPTWSSGITLPTGQPIHRNGTVTRSLDRGRWLLETGNDHKTLDGGSLGSLRYDGNALPTLTGVSSADFGTTAYGRDSQGRVTTVTGTRGSFVATETRTYGLTNAAGAPLPLVTKSVKTLNGYQANPADATVQVGHEYQYDSTSFQWLKAERDLADGRWTQYLVDALGRVTQTTDPLGVITATGYDSWGRVASSARQAIGTVGQPGYIGPVSTTTAYDVYGFWKEETASGAGATITTRTEFDAAGRVTAVKKYNGTSSASPLLGSQTTTYDGWGQKVSQSPWLKAGQSSYGNFTWAYDDQGRLTESRDRVGSADTPAGRVLSTVTQQPKWMTVTGSADGVSVTGVATTTQDDRGYTRTEVHDLLGQKAGIIDQKGQTSLYYYDKDGHLLQTKQGTGASAQLRSYAYNDMGWLISRTEPEEGKTSYGSFTMLGTPLVATQKGRNGLLSNTVTTSLDNHLQPWQIVAQGPEGTVTRTLSYDYGTANTHAPLTLGETQAIAGLPTGNLSETYAYDALGRMKSKTVGDGVQSFTVSRTLDDVGNELSLTYPATGDKAAQTVTTTFDAQLRPTSVSFAGVTRGTMAYDQLSGSSDTTTLTLGNAATTATTVNSGEVVQVTHAAAAGVLESNAVTWSTGGLMLSRGPVSGTGPDTFTYDQLQRLASAHVLNPATGTFVDQSFAYDRFGNRSGVTTTAPAGTLPSPSEALSWTAAYDATNSLPTSVNGLTTGVLYDQLGRMSQVWAIPGQSSSLTQWGYDPSGRVMKETVNGAATTFLLDGEGLRFRRTAADGTPSYTVYGFHREPLAQYVCPLGKVHSGSKAVQIFHKTGNNSALSRYFSTIASGDTITATLWVNAPVGTKAQVFLGNVASNGYTAYDNSKLVQVTGTGAWQQVTVSWTMTHPDWMWLYIYGNTNNTAPDGTSTNYDDIVVSSTLQGTLLTEGFESGLTLSGSNGTTTAWYCSGEPYDVDVAGQPGMAEWQKSMVYGFGQLLSEDQLATGTIYEQSDQVGSPNLITNASGVLINRSKNLPFGERLLLPTPGQPKSTRRYTNHEDQDGSAIYMQARTYLPAYGKFAQVDPAYDQTKDDPESWNLYNYVTNNPVTHTDPDGRIAMLDPPAYTTAMKEWSAGDAFADWCRSKAQDQLASDRYDSEPVYQATDTQTGATGYGHTPDAARADMQAKAPIAETAQTTPFNPLCGGNAFAMALGLNQNEWDPNYKMHLSDQAMKLLTIADRATPGSIVNGKYYPYKDSGGNWTEGFGHLIKKGEDFSGGLTHEEVVGLKFSDIREIVESPMHENINIKLSQNQYDAIGLYFFNAGSNQPKFYSAINRGDFDRAISLHDMKITSKGVIQPGLVIRRRKEDEIFYSGQYPHSLTRDARDGD